MGDRPCSVCSEEGCQQPAKHRIAPARKDGVPDAPVGVCTTATRLDPTRTQAVCGECFETITGRIKPESWADGSAEGSV